MADRTVVLSQNGRHAVRGLSVNNPSEFSAYQDDDDDLTYVVDLSAYLDGATITVVTRVPQGVFISNSSNTTTRLTQRLRGFGYVDFKVQTSAGDVEEFRINILRRTGSKVVLGASGGGGTAVIDGNYGDVVVSGNGTVWTVTGGTGGVTDGDKGDITVSGGGVTWTIDAGAVTSTALADNAVTSAKILDGTIVNADINASAAIAPTKLAFTQTGTGASARTVDAKLKDGWVSVTDFGADPTGASSSYSAIINAIAAVNAAGGGVVYFPPGTYTTAFTITLGNGSASSPSNKDNRIRLVGASYGSSTGLINQQVDGTSRILYNGTASTTTAVLFFEGPMHGVGVENLTLDCNNLAGRGIFIRHVTQGTFHRVTCRNYTETGYYLTTQSANPVGAAFGTCDNTFRDCYGFLDATSSNDITGIILTSGVSTSVDLASQPDSCRNIFIGGTYMYGTTADSRGMWLNGADNNCVIEVLFFPRTGTTSGWDVFFQQWGFAGSLFPLENYFSNLGMSRGVSGNGGVGSSGHNFFFPFPTSDGASLPTITGASGTDHSGKTNIAGQRAYRGRQIVKAELSTPQTTTSTTFVDVTGMSVTLTTLADTKLMINFWGAATKSTSGTAYYRINVDGTDQTLAQMPIVNVSGGTGYLPFSTGTVVDVGAGSHTVKIRYQADAAGGTTLDKGILVVQELY